MDVYSRAKARGIESRYFDWQGNQHIIDAGALTAVLDALPVHRELRHFSGPIAHNAHESKLTVPVRDADGRDWRLKDGRRIVCQGQVTQGAIAIDQALPTGTYILAIRKAERPIESVPVIVAPEKAWQGDGFHRTWLLTVQLYSIRSQSNWGIGDFSDLATLIDLAAASGCHGIGLNPLHALFDDHPDRCSPYAPNSRLFLNSLYVDPAVVPEFPTEWLDRHRQAIETARKGDLINYAAVADLKLSALRAAFAAFQADASEARRRAFDQFQTHGGQTLRRYCCFEVLRKTFQTAWWEWPDEWRNPTDRQVDEFVNGDAADAVRFVAFVQWCADTQLRACVERAGKAGMKIGLYLDVAVGVQSGGFDAWLEQDAISRQLSVGAPPDQVNTAGQDWGLAGFNAAGLQARQFEPFRAMLRASLKFSGAIRLDHVLGLNRLYLVPSGFSPRHGVYVDMPLQALLAVIAQESVAERCMVIGEDLGTVPDGFREQLAARGILSYKVMMFEREHDGSFCARERYGSNSLVTFNTHDLASFAGWRAGHDLQVKRAIDVDPGETDEDRTRANAALDRRLGDDGIAQDLFGVIEFLARTPAKILAVAVEDLLGMWDQPNIPGTVDEHPNWRRRLPVSLESWDTAIDWQRLRQAVRDRA